MDPSGILATESYFPWKKHTEWAPRVHEIHPGTVHSASLHGAMFNALAQTSHDSPSDTIQYAPPLSAYSTNYCGASQALSDYNRSLQLRALSGKEDIPILSPRTMNRLDNLRKIKAAGYTTLAPIGLNRTMNQMDADRLIEADDGGYVHAENSVAAGASTMGEASLQGSHDHNLSSPSAADPILPNSMLLNSMDRDLDSQIVDADFEDSADLDADLDADNADAFMAEDVEYQYDHSLVLDSTANSAGAGDANITFSVIAGLSSGSAPTIASTAPRACEDSDIDMTLED